MSPRAPRSPRSSRSSRSSRSPGPEVDLGRGFLSDHRGGFLLAAQPNGAHTLFPANDHPTDKARFTVTLTVPSGMVGVATGGLVSRTRSTDGATTVVFASRHPVATHVVAIAAGHYRQRLSGGPGSLVMRSVFPVGLARPARRLLARLPRVLAWLRARLGAYPFGTFGLVVYPDSPMTSMLEGQTLVLVPTRLLDRHRFLCDTDAILVHEAAHQWFGDSVSVVRWDEKWLSEGHALYYDWLWRSAEPPACGGATMEDRMRLAYLRGGAVRERHGPPGAPRGPAALYTPAIYDQGALALYALRQKVGPRTFAAIERRFLARHRDGNASTGEFIADASAVARRDLAPFLHAWLYGSRLPPMPGHPDWKTRRPPTTERSRAGPERHHVRHHERSDRDPKRPGVRHHERADRGRDRAGGGDRPPRLAMTSAS